jgi:hypothetical protein
MNKLEIELESAGLRADRRLPGTTSARPPVAATSAEVIVNCDLRDPDVTGLGREGQPRVYNAPVSVLTLQWLECTNKRA